MKLIACAALIALCGCSDETQGKTYDSPVTATDQSNDAADLEITSRIRRALTDAADMSTAGENVTVVTQKGVVTLRGSVPSAEEKSRIQSMATNVAGVQRVDNELTVESK